jgi:hypothetical protein
MSAKGVTSMARRKSVKRSASGRFLKGTAKPRRKKSTRRRRRR